MMLQEQTSLDGILQLDYLLLSFCYVLKPSDAGEYSASI